MLAQVLVLALSTLASCSSLTKDEEERLNNYRYNASLYYDQKDYERAEQQCRKGLELVPKDPVFNAMLGWSMMWQAVRAQDATKMGQAVVQFRTSLDEGYTSSSMPESKLLFGLGACEWWLAQQLAKPAPMDSQRHLQAARENLEKVFEADPENVDAELTLAEVVMFQGEYEPGLKLLDRGLSNLEQQSTVLDRRMKQPGASLEAQSRYQAQRDLNTQREIKLRKMKANVLFKLERYEAELGEFVRIDELGGMQAIDYYNRGQAYEALGKKTAAVSDYETYLKQSNGPLDEFVQSVLRKISVLKSEPGKPLSESK
jgi:tetratricopeptide (TPR) repeat protein